MLWGITLMCVLKFTIGVSKENLWDILSSRIFHPPTCAHLKLDF